MVETAKLGITFVVDHVLMKDNARETIIEKLQGYAHVINIHTQASDPIERFKENIKNHESKEVQGRREFLLSRAEVHGANLSKTMHQIDLGIPTLIVNTDEGYVPNLDSVLEFIAIESKSSKSS